MTLSKEEHHAAMNMAIGRLFRLMSRPTQPGDVEQFYRCRSVVLDLGDASPDSRPNYARDRNRGAQGDA